MEWRSTTWDRAGVYVAACRCGKAFGASDTPEEADRIWEQWRLHHACPLWPTLHQTGIERGMRLPSQFDLEDFITHEKWKGAPPNARWAPALLRIADAQRQCLAHHPGFNITSTTAYFGPVDRLQEGPIGYLPPAMYWHVLTPEWTVGAVLHFEKHRLDVLELIGDFLLRARDDLQRFLATEPKPFETFHKYDF